jgi:hypothetical protein
MTPSKPRALHNVQQRLRTDAFDLYLRLLSELFSNYRELEGVERLLGFIRSKRFDLLLEHVDSLLSQKYESAAMYFAASQLIALVKKYPWPEDLVKTDPEAKAIRTFLASERKCKRLNAIFSLHANSRVSKGIYANKRRDFRYKLHKMREYTRFVLGERPKLEAVLDQCDFGSGASIGVHGNATHIAAKLLCSEWTVSPGAAVYAYWALMRNHQTQGLLLESKGDVRCLDWDFSREKFQGKAKILRYNKVTFVPKTAKTHRAIAVEPLLNGFLQKGVDQVMRKKLNRINIDLSDQSRNQSMARQGSYQDTDDSYVTIDLSSASDSVSIGLVKAILPVEWFELLNSLRSEQYELNGKRNAYYKFCSMGNGFCFPLETLLFVACCHACGCGKPGVDFSVYGDDIIVRRKHAREVLSLLKAMGFKPNTDKTFLEGPFRESCGADWFKGVDVRPYILDYALDSLENIFKWVNLTRRNAFATRFFEGTYGVVLSRVPESFQFWRPFKGEPDTGLDSTGSEHLTSPNCFFDRRRMVWRVKALRVKPMVDMTFSSDARRHMCVDMYALLRGAQSERFRVMYTFRRKTRTIVVRKDNVEATSMWLPPDAGQRLVLDRRDPFALS